MEIDKSGRARWIVDGDRLIDTENLLASAVQIQIMPNQPPVTPASHSAIGFLMPSGIIVQLQGAAAESLKALIRERLQAEGFRCTSAAVNEAWLPPEVAPAGEPAFQPGDHA